MASSEKESPLAGGFQYRKTSGSYHYVKKTGFLVKSPSSNMGRWRRRWCMLVDVVKPGMLTGMPERRVRLEYYDIKTKDINVKNLPKCKGYIDMHSCVAVVSHDRKVKGYKHVFNIVMANFGMIYHLVADTKEEMEDWIKAMNEFVFKTPLRSEEYFTPNSRLTDSIYASYYKGSFDDGQLSTLSRRGGTIKKGAGSDDEAGGGDDAELPLGHARRASRGQKLLGHLGPSTRRKSVKDKKSLSRHEVPAEDEGSLYIQLSDWNLTIIPRDSIKTTSSISSGIFTSADKGTWSTDEFTKTVFVKSGINNQKMIMKEALLMWQLAHPNVSTLLGIVILGTPKMLVTEFYKRGTVKEVLREEKARLESNVVTIGSLKSTLLKYSREIALGLSFLRGKDIVHGALKASNIFITNDNTCKVGGFGEALKVKDRVYQVWNKEFVVPVQWTAPETILEGEYKMEGDVWSFGIVLYELWSLGADPYHDIPVTEIIPKILKGQRLAPPPGCPKAIYELMIQAWHPNREERLEISSAVKYLLTPDIGILHMESPPKRAKSSAHLTNAYKLGSDLQAGQILYRDLQLTYVDHTVKPPERTLAKKLSSGSLQEDSNDQTAELGSNHYTRALSFSDHHARASSSSSSPEEADEANEPYDYVDRDKRVYHPQLSRRNFSTSDSDDGEYLNDPRLPVHASKPEVSSSEPSKNSNMYQGRPVKLKEVAGHHLNWSISSGDEEEQNHLSWKTRNQSSSLHGLTNKKLSSKPSQFASTRAGKKVYLLSSAPPKRVASAREFSHQHSPIRKSSSEIGPSGAKTPPMVKQHSNVARKASLPLAKIVPSPTSEDEASSDHEYLQLLTDSMDKTKHEYLELDQYRRQQHDYYNMPAVLPVGGKEKLSMSDTELTSSASPFKPYYYNLDIMFVDELDEARNQSTEVADQNYLHHRQHSSHQDVAEGTKVGGAKVGGSPQLEGANLKQPESKEGIYYNVVTERDNAAPSSTSTSSDEEVELRKPDTVIYGNIAEAMQREAFKNTQTAPGKTAKKHSNKDDNDDDDVYYKFTRDSDQIPPPLMPTRREEESVARTETTISRAEGKEDDTSNHTYYNLRRGWHKQQDVKKQEVTKLTINKKPVPLQRTSFRRPDSSRCQDHEKHACFSSSSDFSEVNIRHTPKKSLISTMKKHSLPDVKLTNLRPTIAMLPSDKHGQGENKILQPENTPPQLRSKGAPMPLPRQTSALRNSPPTPPRRGISREK